MRGCGCRVEYFSLEHVFSAISPGDSDSEEPRLKQPQSTCGSQEGFSPSSLSDPLEARCEHVVPEALAGVPRSSHAVTSGEFHSLGPSSPLSECK